MKKYFYVIALVLSFSLVGCIKPFKKENLVEIAPNQTAFVVPLEGATSTNQGKFMSLEFLEQNKVATKRISLPQRFLKTGRGENAGNWIPTAKVIVVDRTPVTREWNNENKAVAIGVESKDSIGFSIGVNITALIKEEDAAKFLYNYAGVPLSKIIDTNVRGHVSSILSREYGYRTLQVCKTDKKEISNILLNELKESYEKMGITITNIGLIGGLLYDEKEIQESINKAYISEMAVLQAKQETLKQVEVNNKMISQAEAERKSAEEFAKAQEAMIAKVKLEIEKIKAEAELEKARKWDGKLPEKIVPTNASFLFSDKE